MKGKYELWLTRDNGDRVTLLDPAVKFSFNKIVNGVGTCIVSLPETFNLELLGIDYKIEVWRSPEEGQALRLENAYLIRRIEIATNASAMTTRTLYGNDGNDLLNRRIVAWAAGSAQAEKTDFIDDMMKAIVRENLGALSGNDPGGYSRAFPAAFFSVAPDVGLGGSITKAFAYRNVLSILQDLSEISRIAVSDQVYFWIAPANVTDYIFRTFIDQVGQDRRFPGGTNPTTFSLELGNVQIPNLEDDYDQEQNAVYGAGQGAGAARTIAIAHDIPGMNRSIWGRREGFRDARHEATVAGVASEAWASLSEHRPKRRFSTELTSIEGSRYGIDWDFGDRVSVTYADTQFDGMIKAVSVVVSDDGAEKITGRFEVEGVA